MRNPFELLDRAPVADDRLVEAAALQLHHAEVEQAAADLLDAADALGRLEPSLQLGHRVVEPAEPDVNRAEDARGRRAPTQVVALLEDLPRRQSVLERVLQPALDLLRAAELQEELPDNRGSLVACGLDPGAEHVCRLGEPARDRERPAGLEPERQDVTATHGLAREGVVDD